MKRIRRRGRGRAGRLPVESACPNRCGGEQAPRARPSRRPPRRADGSSRAAPPATRTSSSCTSSPSTSPPSPGTVRSHLTMEVATAGRRAVRGDDPPARPARRRRDRRRLVGERQADARRVRRAPARADIYTSIVTRRRDPALVTWDGPGWIAVSILPAGEEPVAPLRAGMGRAGGGRRRPHPLPRRRSSAERERVVGRASVKVDGRKVAADAARSRRHRRRRSAQGVHAAGAGRPVPAGDGARGEAPTGAPHFVLVVETSAAMTTGDRARQRAVLDALFDELPDDAKLTLLAADWDVLADRRGGRRRRAGPTRSRSWTRSRRRARCTSSASLREAAARARKTGAAAVLFVGSGDDGFRGDAVPRRSRSCATRSVRLSVDRAGAARVPAALARAAARDRRRGDRAARRSKIRVALLVDALRPRAGHPAARRARRRRMAPAPHGHRRRRLDRARARSADAGGRRDRARRRRLAAGGRSRRRCGIARASNGTTATPRTRSRRC